MKQERPPKFYIKAFEEFIGKKLQKGEYKYERIEGHTDLLYEGVTYRISSYEDLVQDFTQYFERESYDEITTQVPEQLWDLMLDQVEGYSSGQIIVGIYKAWRGYWYNERDRFKDPETFKRSKQESFEDLQVLIEAYKEDTDKLVEFAYAISDFVILPCIAMFIKSTYDDLESFVEDSVTILMSECGEYLTMGETFEEIYLPEAENEISHFIIYNPVNDLEECDQE
ncbi:hypothetical protein SAMN05444008_11274 [Cnuella takakiae]|uniref:Uncharacterized protein n=1 Tax=Cnuella takakiae TaxID=1302690 RepID=A0A1M5EJP6_9BACT|nr:hypothetical protein [Cnuella takakiae]OLY91200.1 hypothetical protein BUE76_04270 [Cnuella takakiae]SHF79445.1 hypothetical protein SAMN05444008_11274 [Cnuella takakiae]